MIIKFDDNNKPELNITPLVDIMLVLLAILMVTAPTLTYQENVVLPTGSKTKSAENNLFVVVISKDRIVHIGKRNMSLMELPDNLALLKQQYNVQSPVFIKADETLPYKDVIFVLKSLKNIGFSKFALGTK